LLALLYFAQRFFLAQLFLAQLPQLAKDEEVVVPTF
jgi:hypothetical protein